MQLKWETIYGLLWRGRMKSTGPIAGLEILQLKLWRQYLCGCPTPLCDQTWARQRPLLACYSKYNTGILQKSVWQNKPWQDNNYLLVTWKSKSFK